MKLVRKMRKIKLEGMLMMMKLVKTMKLLKSMKMIILGRMMALFIMLNLVKIMNLGWWNETGCLDSCLLCLGNWRGEGWHPTNLCTYCVLCCAYPVVCPSMANYVSDRTAWEWYRHIPGAMHQKANSCIHPLPSPVAHPQVIYPHHLLAPAHPQLGCPAIWRHHHLPTVTAHHGISY